MPDAYALTTTTDINTPPASGLQHIDALLDTGPGWNWLAPARNVLYYTFALSPASPSQGSLLAGPASTFNAAQQAATVAILNYVGQLTGIVFTPTSNGDGADLHFAAGNIASPSTSGYCSWGNNWSNSGDGTILSYSADAYIYLDNADWASISNAPTVAGGGWELILHEVGHALGLKHPFEGSVTLPAGQENTAYSVMSYTHVGGPYGVYSPYDIAALMWLYGGDGLGGLLGQGTSGRYLVGTAGADVLTGGGGNDVFEGSAGNDTINGGSGSDTARYGGNRALYTISSTTGGGYTVSGPDGTDTLTGIESVHFADQTISLATPNSPPTGTLGITGTPLQGAALGALSTLADADGLGSFSWRWQAALDGGAWSDIAAATGTLFTPAAAQVGRQLRVLVSWTDGRGTLESVASPASAAVLGSITGTSGNDTLAGSAYADLIKGLQGNDRVAGGGGNDDIDGGDGIDTAVFTRPRADYKLSVSGATITSQALQGGEGTDTLHQVERLAFADISLAFDIDGHAGTTARFLGAVFGRESVANSHYVGIGLALLDTGTSNSALMQLALEARLGTGFTNADEVRLLYRNLLGIEPPIAELNYWTGTLTAAIYTPVSLALMAADLDLNAHNVDLVGLAQTGLGFS